MENAQSIIAQVSMNMKSIYQYSVDELAKMRDSVEQRLAALDMNALTDAEKYTAITAIYEETFGKDFREPHLSSFSSMAGITKEQQARYGADAARQALLAMSNGLSSAQKGVGIDYNAALKKYIAKGENGEERLRNALIEAKYPGMGAEEIQDAIAARYPPADRMTNGQFLAMTTEMQEAGVDCGINGRGYFIYVSAFYPAADTSLYAFSPDNPRSPENVLRALRFDPKMLAQSHNTKGALEALPLSDAGKRLAARLFNCII